MEGAARLLQLVVNGAAAGCIYGLIALGFVLIYKATEMINFAQGDIMMLGGFFAFALIAHFGVNYWIGAQPWRSFSSSMMSCLPGDSPMPPNSFGQPGHSQPLRASLWYQTFVST